MKQESAGFIVLNLVAAVVVTAGAACRAAPPSDSIRVSGAIEATDVQLASPVGGRLLELRAGEGDHVQQGDVVAVLDAADARLALARTKADRDQADAQLRLLQSGARPEDVRLAEAQVVTAESEVRASEVERAAAQIDVDRFEQLLAARSGSRKQRDDAVARRDAAEQRVQSARTRVRAAHDNVARVSAGARREEIDAARARVAAAEAQMATWQKSIDDATVMAPQSGVVTARLAEPGDVLAPRAAIVVITDLSRPWANVYVDEPFVPRLRVGSAVNVFTDAGGPSLPGAITLVSDKAEFTPRNVQTAEDRSKLVYRVKVSLENPHGILKPGMPVEAEIPLQR